MVRQYYPSATPERHAKIRNKKGGPAAAPLKLFDWMVCPADQRE